jgi:heme-degrading monooxygenase HmoA
MVIVFVYWKIKKGHEEAFKTKWRSGLPVNDRSGLVGEFLSQPTGHEKYDWITWDLRGTEDYTPFINIGMWANAEAFHDQIGKYFKPEKEKDDFEFEIRTRALLKPDCWRMGDSKLAIHDSGGVL